MQDTMVKIVYHALRVAPIRKGATMEVMALVNVCVT
jgi:hypothetical protein